MTCTEPGCENHVSGPGLRLCWEHGFAERSVRTERALSDLVCDWREKFQKQLARAVAAEERAGRKNVARLEARIAELETELAEARK